METGGGPPVSLLPPLPGDGALLMLSVLALGVKNTWGGSMGEWGWSKGSGTACTLSQCFYTQQISAVELRLAGVPVGQGGGVAWLPPALWGQLGVSLSFGTPRASGAGWRALVPLFCLWGKRGGMACG